MENPLDTLLEALTRHRPISIIYDKMLHTGGVGLSRIERWPASGLTHAEAEGPWLWRVVWYQRGVTSIPQRIAFGMAESQEDAKRQGRKEARRLAKERRAA